MSLNLGVDVGGTFTDVLVFDRDTNDLTVTKVLTTPEQPSEGVVEGVTTATAEAGTDIPALDAIFHGTTVVTNMLLEETGSQVGLITTAGHEHVLHLARAWTPGPLYGWMAMEKPDPLADLVDTRGIDARVSSPDGEIESTVDTDEVRDAVDELVANGVEAITVSLINSYLNPTQEQAVREVILDEHPSIPVSISSDIVTEYGEYERTLTTVINDYASPHVISYLDDLEGTLGDNGFDGRMNIVRSDGGLVSAATAKEHPVAIALSGPSGGVVGAAAIAGRKGIDNVLTLDMGGTSTDVSLVEDGEPEISYRTKVGYHEFKSRTIDINTVGAGGGSIARVQLSGSMQVGPESAGADPGPACYARGGEQPTVTDANVVLGRIPPSVKLGGTLELDRSRAFAALEGLADERGTSVEEAAQAVIDVVNENMHGALRVVSVERGYDPREFGFVAFGGAGPMHANKLVDLMDAYPLIIPPGPGVLSAFGFLTSDIQNEFTETYLQTEVDVSGDDVYDRFDRLRAEGAEWLAGEGVAPEDQSFSYFADCRYFRQDIQMSIPVDPADLRDGTGLDAVKDDFVSRYERQFEFTLDAPLEIATLRVIGKGRVAGVELEERPTASADPSDAETGVHEVYFDGAYHDTPIYERDRLRPGNVLEGPAIVTDEDSTVVVQPDHVGTVDRFTAIEVTRGGAP